MIRYWISILTVILFWACSDEGTPLGILPEDQMVVILKDIHMTEGKVSALPIPYDSSQTLYKLLEKEVFLKHEVSDSVFTQSMRFYLEDPVKMDRIYARLIDSLTVLESNNGKEENF